MWVPARFRGPLTVNLVGLSGAWIIEDEGMGTYPLFLSFADSAPRLDQIRERLAILHPYVNPSCVVGVDVYYRAANDTTILGVHLDVRVVSAPFLDRIRAAAELAEGVLVDPAMLREDDRRCWFDSHLPLHDEMTDFPGIEDALGVLARWLGRTLSAPVQEGGSGEVLQVCFRRGELWQPARARELTTGGVYLCTGAPPRRGDLVTVRFQGAGVAASVDALVIHVTRSTAASALGASGFGVRFREPPPEQRAELERVLELARGSELMAPVLPPRRRSARYPVAIPVIVQIGGVRGHLVMVNLSSGGMFLAADEPLPPLGAEVGVMVPPETGSGHGPIEAQGRIVRGIARAEAEQRGVVSGIGIEVAAFSKYGAKPWAKLVERVARRVEQSVVVGAAVGRLGQLCSELQGAGYSAVGYSDARHLVMTTLATSRPPDLVVLDATLGKHVIVARRMLERKAVRILGLDVESPADCRELIDTHLLARSQRGAQAAR